ncbi:MAG: hypothetical protein Q4D94_14175 [Bacillota bacterium]|nr:hypothetical protein [Bacillota bacterium]
MAILIKRGGTIMKSKYKIFLAIPAFLMTMAGDYLIGYEPWDVEPLGLIADTGWLTIADWRIALSNLFGAAAVPLYFVAAKEFLRILDVQNPKGNDKGTDRFLWLFRIGNYAGILSFVFIHIACGLLILQFNAAYEMMGNVDMAMELDLRIFRAEALPFFAYFVVADLFTTIGWIGLVVKRAIPLSKVWLLASPLVMTLIGQVFSIFHIGFKGIDSGFESLGWILMFIAAVKYAQRMEKQTT